MPKLWPKNRFLLFSVSLLLLGTIIKLILTFRSQLGLTISETEVAYLAKSIRYALSSEGKPLLSFAREHGYFLFPVQLVLLSLFIHTLPPSTILLRIPQLILSFTSMVILLLLIYKRHEKTTNQKLLVLLSMFIILFSPWHQTLTFFHLPESLSLLFFSTTILLLTKVSKKKLLSINQATALSFLLLFSALSSWAGLFSTLALAPLIPSFLKKLINQKQLRQFILASALIIYIPLGFIMLANRQYIKTSLSHETFISKLKPSSLAEEINKRQQIDFLAADRQFILPATLRKFIYNKPLLATQKTVKQIINLFDFEQFASPLISYDITHLSGLLPKGNLPLGYFWDIPIFTIGLFILLKRLPKRDSWILYFLIAAMIPAIIFEKKNLTSSGSLLVPILLVIEVDALKHITRALLKLQPLLINLIIIILTMTTSMGVLGFYRLFFFNEFGYRTSHTYFFQEISRWLAENREHHEKIVVTTRFGPTHLMSSFYLNFPPQNFWQQYLFPEKADRDEIVKIENLEFRPINFPDEEKSSKVVYVGFPGEFVRPGKDLDSRTLPPEALILDKIVAPDELVFNYGENLWVITFP